MATATPRAFNLSCSSASVLSLLAATTEEDQIGMRLDPLRMAVAALALGPDIALAPFHGPPPDRARRTDAKPLSCRSTRQPALTRANDTSTKVNR
jgi:hypothetical protein